MPLPGFLSQFGQFGTPANMGLLGFGGNLLNSGLQGQSTGQGLAAGIGGGLGGYLGQRQLQQDEQQQKTQQQQLMELLYGRQANQLGAGYPMMIGAAGGGMRPY